MKLGCIAALALLVAAPSWAAGSAGVTVVLPKGWHELRLAVPPPGMKVGDPVTRIAVASAPIDFGPRGCNDVDYAFSNTAVAIVVLEWVRRTPGVRWAPRPHRFTAKTLPIMRPPAIECFDGPGGSVQFQDHGRRFAAFVLLGRKAPPGLARRARGVLDTLRVGPA